MKRTWIGAGLLALLLGLGLLTGAVMASGTAAGAENLRRAADAALAEDWDRAQELTDSVKTDWEKRKWLAEVLTTHEDLERIEISFAQLPSCAGNDGPAYSALCTALAQQLEALGKAHGCSLENLL